MGSREEGRGGTRLSGVIRDFKDLVVWQRSMDLVVSIYRATSELPNSEAFGLRQQMRRASVSAPSNVAEGYRHGTRKQYHQFVCTAHGSIGELETQILICKRLGFLEGDCPVLLDDVDQLSRMLNVLTRKLA